MTKGSLLEQVREAARHVEALLRERSSAPLGTPQRAAADAELDSARRTEAALRRRLAEDFGEEAVVRLFLGFEPSPSISGGLLFQSEDDAVLVFNTVSAEDEVALITFSGPALTRFGLPNDEALKGHPLRERGLEAYACLEVLNSTWRSEVEAQNRRTFPKSVMVARHFVFTFHDATLEVLARGLSHEVLRDRDVAVRRALMHVHGQPAGPG